MTVELRKLDPEQDATLVREAVAWLDSQPLFFRNCDAAWGDDEGADKYLALMRNGAQSDFGVFDSGRFVAVVTVTLEGKGVFNSHLMARRRADPRAVAMAVAGVLKGLLAEGMIEGWSWLARRNYGARRVLESVGMRRDGVTRFKGRSHGRPIEWVRYSVGRAA